MNYITYNRKNTPIDNLDKYLFVYHINYYTSIGAPVRHNAIINTDDLIYAIEEFTKERNNDSEAVILNIIKL